MERLFNFYYRVDLGKWQFLKSTDLPRDDVQLGSYFTSERPTTRAPFPQFFVKIHQHLTILPPRSLNHDLKNMSLFWVQNGAKMAFFEGRFLTVSVVLMLFRAIQGVLEHIRPR